MSLRLRCEKCLIEADCKGLHPKSDCFEETPV